MSKPASHHAYSIRAVDRVCDILDTLANSTDGAHLSDVAEATNLPKSSAFRYLAALEHRHYVQRRNESGTYTLGPAFRPQDNTGIEQLAEAARPALEQLRDRYAETTNLGILDGTQIVHILVAESPHMMRLAARVGERGGVHSTALGKAILAHQPEQRVRSILHATGMPRFTDTTLVDVEAYLAELERTRHLGFGIDEEEHQTDGRCVAVAIPDLPIPAGISVSAPASRMSAAAAAKVGPGVTSDCSRPRPRPERPRRQGTCCLES